MSFYNGCWTHSYQFNDFKIQIMQHVENGSYFSAWYFDILNTANFLVDNKNVLYLNKCFYIKTSLGTQLCLKFSLLKGVFAKNERGYRLNAIKKRFLLLLILLLSVASIRRKLLKTTNTEESSVHTNSERCSIRLRP